MNLGIQFEIDAIYDNEVVFHIVSQNPVDRNEEYKVAFPNGREFRFESCSYPDLYISDDKMYIRGADSVDNCRQIRCNIDYFDIVVLPATAIANNGIDPISIQEGPEDNDIKT